MRNVALLVCAAFMLGACAVDLCAADTKPKPSKTSRRVKKAAKAAPQLRKVSDKDRKAALKEQAQKLQERWAKSAAENAAKAAAESARATQELKELREEIVRLRQELAQVREAVMKREAAAKAAEEKERSEQKASAEPQEKPEKAMAAKAEPEKPAEATPKPEAKPIEAPQKEAKEKPQVAKEEALSKELQILIKQINKTGDIKPPKKPVTWATIDLSKLFNGDGISYDENRRDSDFDEYHQAYAAELLPEPGLVKPLGHVPDLPFVFPPKKEGAKNNISCEGQRVAVPKGRYAALYVMGSTTFGEQEGDVKLECEKGEKTATLKLSDWCAASKFGEAQAYTMTQRHNWDGKDEQAVCSMWVQAIELPSDKTLKAMVLPKNPKIHIFAMTLAKVQ